MKRSLDRGFTLIELLVVIAIIGVLSAVVLAQLNSARTKGNDAQKRANFANLATRGAFYYESNGESFLGVCSDSKFQEIYTVAGAGVGGLGGCTNSATSFRVRTQLSQTNVFSGGSGVDWLCADTDQVKVEDNDPGAGGGAPCP